MTSAALLQEISDYAPPLPMKRFTVEEYHRMISSGAIEEGAPYELLEGWIIRKMSRNPPHDFVIVTLHNMLQKLLPDACHVRGQTAVTFSDSEPEPDLCIVAGTTLDYAKKHPGPDAVLLVIEIGNTSLERDRTLKSRIYARAGIQEYWLVNVTDRCVEVYSKPGGKSDSIYKGVKVYREKDKLPLTIKGKKVGMLLVRDILPPA